MFFFWENKTRNLNRILMKHQALFSSKDKSKKRKEIKSRLLHFLFINFFYLFIYLFIIIYFFFGRFKGYVSPLGVS